MKGLFSSLAVKCLSNNLRFEYIPESQGIIVMDDSKIVASGWLDRTPIKELMKMHHWVDRYIENEEELSNVRTTSTISAG